MTVRSRDPEFSPKQLTLVIAISDVKLLGSLTVAVASEVHAVLVSDTITLYIPAERPVIDAVVAPLFHRYVKLPEPPVTFTVAVPSFNPLQETGVVVVLAERFKQVPGLTLTVALAVQPFLSVTVTV